MNGQNRSDIRPGLEVDIVLKADQPTGKLTRGIVADILTSSPTHHRGIKVRLKDGQVGRVQNIVSAGSEPIFDAPKQNGAVDKIFATAEAFRRVVEESTGTKLGYDEVSIIELDSIIDRVLQNPPTDLEQTVQLFGCFLGQALAEVLDGEWGENKNGKMAVIFRAPNGDIAEANVFAKVEKRFRNGTADSLTYYYRMLQKVVAGDQTKN